MIQVYFVATPIGNLGEITYRAVETLKSVDVIYCEDTRHSLQLLKAYDISKPLRAYHKFNERGSVDGIIAELKLGRVIAVISDAGMPCVSDPGNILVNALINNGIEYTFVSGASALINAFGLSGFDAPFTFVGFLPEKTVDKDNLMESVVSSSTLIFYSSVHNVEADLDYLFGKLGARKVCVVREISKMFEQTQFGILGEITLPNVKGEFVILVDKSQEVCPLNALTVDEHIAYYVKNGLQKMDAIKQVAKDRNVSKNEIYKLTL